MGKKIKIGKQRRDKYYRLAKEAGLRSRAVFKLTQLNRKFEFLENSHVLVDLCAAPGGWLQMASKYMPVSSLIVGVDLVSIKSMPNVITLQEDITKRSCIDAVKKELKTWLADCVLHDGAPNVGKNWGHDAFMQAQLTLSALRLTTEVLKRGGWFVTKIFRSKDHPALIEVFKKLFKKVYVTKPDASRSESAEIYVVCQGYLKPQKIDPGLLDSKIVFKDANLEPEKPKLNLFRPEKQKRKAEGYAEGDYTLHHRLSVKTFIEDEKFLDLLADTNEIIIDDDVIDKHPLTDDEIRACCRDIKVLGRKELRDLLTWRKKLRQHFRSLQPKVAKVDKEVVEESEEVILERKVNEAKVGEKRIAKKKRKKDMKEKRKKKQKLDLQMIIPGDRPDLPEEMDLFNLKEIKKIEEAKAKDLEFSSPESESDLSDVEFDDDLGEIPSSAANKFQEDADTNYDESLLVQFENDDESSSVQNKTDKWFEKDIFNDLIDEKDEDAEIERVVAKTKRKMALKNGTADETSSATNKNEETSTTKDTSALNDDDSDLNSSDSDESGFEIVKNKKEGNSRVTKLDAEGLALGEMWIHSSKSRRDLIELGFNRFTNNDENLPDWFVTDEKKHWRKRIPVTKEAVEEYKKRMREINARPIKKVAEAKARKRKRAVRKMEKARKKSEAVVDNPDMTERQKSQEVRKIYKRFTSTANKKPEVSYVVAKKGQMGKRARRPAGVAGRYKVVDHRLKKDIRRLKGVSSKKNAKGGGSKNNAKKRK